MSRSLSDAAPWWDALSEYPSALDVKRLRRTADALLLAARMAEQALPIALRFCLRPEDQEGNPNVLALRHAIALAEGRLTDPPFVAIDPTDLARVFEHGSCGNPACPACGGTDATQEDRDSPARVR